MMNDNELLRLAMRRDSLQEREKYAFDAEMSSRGFLPRDLANNASHLETAGVASVDGRKRTNWLKRLLGALHRAFHVRGFL